MSVLLWQTGLVEVICLDVFIHPPKGFISRCEKCDQRLPASNNNSSEFGWNWTCQHVSPSPVLWKARHFHTSLPTCEARIIPVIQMYPQGSGRGSVTATLWWWWGSVRGCDDALVWQLIYCVTFLTLFLVESSASFPQTHAWNQSLDVGADLMWKVHTVSIW